jgi:hypothetical protein
MVSEHLQRYDRDDRLQVVRHGRHAENDTGFGSHLVRVRVREEQNIPPAGNNFFHVAARLFAGLVIG